MNRVAPLFLAALIGAVSVHCGGGGGSGGGGGVIVPPGGNPVFASNGNCTNGAVRMQPGDVNGTMFDIDIMVTSDITSFYGAGFDVSFSGATFVGIDTTEASFLDGLPNEFLAGVQQPGVLTVGAGLTAQQAGITPSATVPLVTLTFQATDDGDLDFVGPGEQRVDVCTTPTACQEQMGVCWDGGTLTVM